MAGQLQPQFKIAAVLRLANQFIFGTGYLGQKTCAAGSVVILNEVKDPLG
jgi:hypothetical protein